MRGYRHMQVFTSLVVICLLHAGCGRKKCVSNYDCSEPTPVCLRDDGRCVECAGDAYCSDPTPFCDRVEWVCVGCAWDEDCDDGDPCSIEGCESGQCWAEPLPEGTPCDDGTTCTTGEACQSGRCVGEPLDCDDGDPCTLDTCQESTGLCQNAPALVPGAEGPPGDASCDNGRDDDCDGSTDAQDPSCIPCSVDSDCDDQNLCTDDACRQGVCENSPAPNGTPCGDGVYCTIEAGCLHGFCNSRERDCSDDNRCTLDLCSNEEERCVNTWQELPGETELCSDGIDQDCDGLTDECCQPGGVFAARVDLQTPGEKKVSAIAGGDFNQDDLTDLAALIPDRQAVGVLICTGALAPGTSLFAGWEFYTVGRDPNAVLAADFNSDGVLDLAVANHAEVSILIGNVSGNQGEGTFTARGYFAAPEDPSAMIAGDFDKDGALDLAVAGMYTDVFQILLGTGDGGFRPGASFPTGNQPNGLLAADFDSDGDLDLAVANFRSESVSVFPGSGDGSFADPREYAIGGLASALAAADFDSDGVLDLAVTNMGSAGGSTLSVLLGNGDGTFAARTDYPSGEAPGSVVAADFDSDGPLDLAAACMRSFSVEVFSGRGDGTFGTPRSYPVCEGPRSLVIADFLGDGGLNLAMACAYSDGISLLLSSAGCP